MSDVHTPLNPPHVIDAEEIQPLDKFDETLREGFAKALTEQAMHFDELAKQLITLELAIPGLYAVALKLVSGDTAKLNHSAPIILAFICWLLALGFTFGSLIPEKYTVDKNSLSDIQRYFSQSAKHKLYLLIPSSALCFFGICLVVFDIFLA
jgi:hypothetical protein